MNALRLQLILSGMLSVLFYLGINYLSFNFNWGEGYRQRPILEYLLLYAGLFVFYAVAVFKVWKSAFDKRAFWIVIAFGLIFRAAIFPAQQIQEDDVYRYLWDGKTFAHGINPYKYSPNQVTFFKQFMIRDPERFSETYDMESVRELEKLATLKWDNETSLIFMERINHPDVPTIYPPLAQFVFAGVHQIKPDHIIALRFAFFGFDILTLLFVIRILKTLGKNPSWCIVYFWSPLVIKETFNSTHLDIIGIACMTGALYFLIRARFFSAQVFLALSVLGKLYSGILLPFFIKEHWTHMRAKGESPWLAVVSGALIFVGVIASGYAPFINIGRDAFQGLGAFSKYWESNDSIFALILFLYRDVFGISSADAVGFSHDLPSFLAKITVALILLGTLTWLFFKKSPDQNDESLTNGSQTSEVLTHCFIIMALVFVLSPVQNPWYLCWVVPFLCVFPNRAWLLLTGLVGLYYLDFYWDYQEMSAWKTWTPWIEYTPFYVLLLVQYFNRRTGHAAGVVDK